jgi:hypothetical protein
MRRLILLLPLLSFTACTEAVAMRDPVTGLTKLCGPQTEARCIEDLKAQGYEQIARDWWSLWSSL